MRVEIVDISSSSTHFKDKDMLIGKTGTLATKHIWGNGFVGGIVYFDNRSPLYFHEIKTKPIYDA